MATNANTDFFNSMVKEQSPELLGLLKNAAGQILKGFGINQVKSDENEQLKEQMLIQKKKNQVIVIGAAAAGAVVLILALRK